VSDTLVRFTQTLEVGCADVDPVEERHEVEQSGTLAVDHNHHSRHPRDESHVNLLEQLALNLGTLLGAH
jgi:hypothetical protein